MEALPAHNPLKISVAFQNENWTAADRRQFIDTMEQALVARTQYLWVGTMRRLPHGIAYHLEDAAADEPLYRLSFAPGFEGGPLTMTATLLVPPSIQQHVRIALQERLEAASKEVKSSFSYKILLPALGWLLRQSDRVAEIRTEVDEHVKMDSPKVREILQRDAVAYWATHAAAPLLQVLLSASVAAIESMPHLDKMKPLLLSANGRVMEVGIGDVTLPASPEVERTDKGVGVLRA